MFSERELDIMRVEAQENVDEIMQTFYKHFYGDRNYGIQGQTGRQLGEFGQEVPENQRGQSRYQQP